MRSTRNTAIRCHRAVPKRKVFSRPAALPAARSTLVGFAALLGVAALAGCAAESKLLRGDPDLAYAALRDGKLAVLGVVKVEEVDRVRPPLIAMLEKALTEERADLPLIRAESVFAALGKTSYRRILLGYEYQGRLEPADLRELADSLAGVARFVVLARVVSDRIRYSTRGVSEADSTQSQSAYGLRVAGRNARVDVHLYDLATRSLSFGAEYSGSSESSKPARAPMDRPPQMQGVDIGVQSRAAPEVESSPEPPELALAVEEPFRAFARSLPRGEPKVPPAPAPRGGP